MKTVKQLIIIVLTMFLLPAMSHAQKKLTIMGEVFDKVTHANAYGSKVYLLNSDNKVIDSATVGGADRFRGKIVKRRSLFNFTVDVPAKYILNVVCDGYAETNVPLSFNKAYRREITREIPNIYLKKADEHLIDEVTVVATKIKFYNKGDTTIFNADAFQLSEGSMLDALVRQLPGAELKDDGRIYINGKFVESLMLNGKDFLKGNNEVLLDNLPTYMVKNIKVYDKKSEMSEWLGRDIEQKSLVMDVGLKKQYNTGWVANVEAGGGTVQRYLARLFAMRFTDHSRLALYANVNNTNDSRKPGQNTEWTPEKMPKGMMTTRMAGVDFNLEPRSTKLKYNANVQAEHSDNNVRNTTSRTNFLTGGDTYDRIVNSSRACDSKITVQNFLQSMMSKWYFRLSPNFSYHKYKNKGDNLSATSDKVLSSLEKTLLDDLFSDILTPQLQNILINRNIEHYKRDGHEWRVNNEASLGIRVPHTSDLIIINNDLEVYGAGNDDYSTARIEYPLGTATGDYRNLYAKGVAGRGYKYGINMAYNYFINKNSTLTLGYKYSQSYQQKKRSLFRLDRLTGWSSDTEHELGTLPSVSEYEQVMDAGNSFNSTVWDKVHTPSLVYFCTKTTAKGGNVGLDISVQTPIHNENMNYERGSLDTTMVRKKMLLDMYATMTWTSADGKRSMNFGVYTTPSLPDMAYYANVRDDVNPLVVTHGNKCLKPTYRHSVSGDYTYRLTERQIVLTPMIKYNYYQNRLAMGYVYDKTTGRKDVTPQNVNGNWDMSMALNSVMPFDKKRTFMWTNKLSLSLYHSVDICGNSSTMSTMRSTVMTRDLSDELTVEKSFGKQKLALKAMFANIHSSSEMDTFENINAYNFSYGLLGTFKLPQKIDLSADMTMYSRRGYEDDAMNSNDFLFNARLSRPFMKGKLVLIADAFDIFHQLSNVQRYLNAQGRTETHINSLPRYVMLHCIYRINVRPKKKM